ncbi:GATA zinc finger domain-containing protein 14-like isoform X2 [Cimex lectularius]|uniref:Uncharacterized protein n=1 Tax=Cimex lectularius TaxID=79782 RepID=A0A8I6SEF6_CIMLE|nr:GATA zinc finger domain-containing protein 14-like isoform X2 [Cimex lectularius]
MDPYQEFLIREMQRLTNRLLALEKSASLRNVPTKDWSAVKHKVDCHQSRKLLRRPRVEKLPPKINLQNYNNMILKKNYSQRNSHTIQDNQSFPSNVNFQNINNLQNNANSRIENYQMSPTRKHNQKTHNKNNYNKNNYNQSNYSKNDYNKNNYNQNNFNKNNNQLQNDALEGLCGEIKSLITQVVNGGQNNAPLNTIHAPGYGTPRSYYERDNYPSRKPSLLTPTVSNLRYRHCNHCADEESYNPCYSFHDRPNSLKTEFLYVRQTPMDGTNNCENQPYRYNQAAGIIK